MTKRVCGLCLDETIVQFSRLQNTSIETNKEKTYEKLMHSAIGKRWQDGRNKNKTEVPRTESEDGCGGGGRSTKWAEPTVWDDFCQNLNVGMSKIAMQTDWRSLSSLHRRFQDKEGVKNVKNTGVTEMRRALWPKVSS